MFPEKNSVLFKAIGRENIAEDLETAFYYLTW